MHDALPFHCHRKKNESQEEAIVRTAMERMRDPNQPLADRLVAWRVLHGRKGLGEDRAESIAIHRKLLARLVATSVGAKVEAQGETFYAEKGLLMARVGYGPRPMPAAK